MASTVNGQPFDVKDYPYDEDSQAQIVNFVEYCYSYKGNMQGNYGLYVYVYNPQGLNISTNSKSNKIQMAVSYDSEGNPNDYAKFDLLFLSKSENSDYKNLFYKFKGGRPRDKRNDIQGQGEQQRAQVRCFRH